MLDSKSYTKCLLSMILLGVLFAGIFNWYINPYHLYNVPPFPASSLYNQELSYSNRIIKPYLISKLKPSVIILGTSRAEAFDINYRGFNSEALNLSLPAATIYEMSKLLQYANDTGKLKQVVVLLDFISFDADKLTEKSWNEKWFSPINVMSATLISIDSLKLSLNCLKQYLYPIKPLVREPISVVFEHTERDYIQNTYRNGNYRIGNTLESYRLILQIAYKNNIDLKLMTSPCHVTHWQTLKDIGLYSLWGFWKSELVRINQEEAVRAGKQPLAIWDFSLRNEYTEEPIPETGDYMQYYGDSSHFKREIADMMLDNVFGYSKGFGRILW